MKEITATIESAPNIEAAIPARGLSAELDLQMTEYTGRDYNVLSNKPQINSVTLSANTTLAELGIRGIHYDTTENWDAQGQMVSEEGDLYIYSDHETIYDGVGNPTFVPGIKIGDGQAYLSDLPFVSDAMTAMLLNHVSNDTIHITAAERAFWNNKVSSFLDPQESEKLILSKTNYEMDGEII